MTRARLRAINSREPEIANLARDVQQAIDSVVQTRVLEFVDVYREPMLVPFDHEPKGVRALRVRLESAPEEAQYVSAHVPFVYRNGAVEITAIEWLTEGERYRFALEMVG
jgi:hypothetical protein